MDHDSPVYVLLGTYNGANFLSAQLNSIQQQTFRNWYLLIRDDGSQDDTCRILEEISQKDGRVEILKDEKGHLGITENFAELMLAALKKEAPIVCFADQDDVWLPNKIADQVNLLQEKQHIYGTDMPILVYSDLTVVDQNLNTIHDSLMECQGIHHQPDSPLKFLLTQNFVTGCAAIINRPLLQIVMPIPAAALLHDWWIALCAAAYGRIEYLNRSTLLYRQHDRNQIGIIDLRSVIFYRNKLVKHWRRAISNFRGSFKQAIALKHRIHNECRNLPSHEVIQLIDAYIELLRMTPLRRMFIVKRFGFNRQGWLRNFLFLVSLLLEPSVSNG